MNALATLGQFGLFLARCARAAASHPLPVERSLEEAYRIGVRSLPILVVISFFVGTNLAVQGYEAFEQMGGQSLLGMFVALAGVRELAPIMVAAMVAAKAGTEMASQIAVMRIREQIDALEVMAVDPYAWLVTPRFLGILLVLPALTVISIATLMTSAWMVTVWQLGESGPTFVATATATATGFDLVVAGLKAGCFGTLICTISCFFGFTSRPGPTGVGAATNASVVVSAVACAILNWFLSEIAYG